MKKNVLFLLCSVLFFQVSFAQTQGDTTVPVQDSNMPSVQQVNPASDTTAVKPLVVRKKKDTTVKAVVPIDSLVKDSIVPPPPPAPVTVDTIRNFPVTDFLPLFQATLRNHPYFNFFGKPRPILMQKRLAPDKDDLFYFFIGLFFYYALVRIFYSKYLQNITTLFFRVTMRQAQLREQLSQAALPSLLLNILFVITGGMFLAFMLPPRGPFLNQNIWILSLWGSGIVLAIYLGKFIILKIVGWIFNVSNATDTYIFLIFMVNKMVGIFLLPVLVLLAFPFEPFLPVVQTLAVVGLASLLVYRFIISYKPIRSEIKLSRFHFFVYLCAFEIAPLLLIYKVLLIFMERN